MAAENMPKNRFQRFIDRVFRRNSEVSARPETSIQPEAPKNDLQEPMPGLEDKRRAWESQKRKVINERSPYAKEIVAALENNELEHADALLKEERLWAEDMLDYMSREEKTGLLSDAAKDFLEKKFGFEKELIDIFDGSRGTKSSWALDFNKAVHRAALDGRGSDDIRSRLRSLVTYKQNYEPEKFQAINISMTTLYSRINEAELRTDREQLIDELAAKSPYLSETAKAEAFENSEEWDYLDKLEVQSYQWAAEQADYLLNSPVSGLLSEPARQCLREDYGLPDEVIDLFGTSREGYIAKAESLNSAIENAVGSRAISGAVKSLNAHIEIYEADKLNALIESKGLDWDKIHNDIHINIIPRTAAERSAPARSAPVVSESHIDSPKPMVFRAAPMLAATPTSASPDLEDESKEPESDKGKSR